MKILQKGTLPQNILYIGTCTNCSCKVEASYTEVTGRNLGDRYSGEFIETYVLCPTQGCGRRIIVVEKPSSAEVNKALENLMTSTSNHKCGLHRVSELARRLKKLKSTHDQTLSGMADDL